MSRAGGLVVVGALVGACGPGYHKLDVDKIASVAVVVEDGSQRFCAYRPAALRALVTYKNGALVKTRALGESQKDLLRTAEFSWSTSHGQVDDEAVLALPAATLDWLEQAIVVRARVVARPEVVGEDELEPRFDCGGTLDVRGASGARGGEAEDGGAGGAGPEVEVALAYMDSPRRGRLVLVRIRQADSAPRYLVLAPGTPRDRLVIDASGGDGGRGGQGIAGVDGRPGVDGLAGARSPACEATTPGQSGADGEPGQAGGPGRRGGDGGDGGRVAVRYDARFPELRGQIEIKVDGGAAGEAGAGGAGGRGGVGGRGGTGGTGTNPDGTACQAPDGAGGHEGTAGGAGQPGGAGSVGPVGQTSDAPGPVAELFADELARGLPIVAEGSGT